MGNVFLFTGDNSYAIRQEVSRWVGEFKEKHGEANLIRISSIGLTASAFLNEVAIAPFIAEHRLVIVDGIPSFSSEGAEKKRSAKEKPGMRETLQDVHPQVVVLFIAPNPDRRLTATKELLEIATVRDFPQVRGEALLAWLKATFQGLGATAERDALLFLLELVGEDQEVLSQECAKLALHAAGRPVTRADVEALVPPSAEQTIWHLLDLLGEGRAEEAITYCQRLKQRGESAQGMWTIFLWIVSSLVDIAAAVAEGTVGLQSVIQATGVKFGAARALLPLARKCRREAVQDLLDRVTEADLALKTGAYRSASESEEEAMALLDRCLLAFPRA
jgi:DNA polymerase III delta subunit